MGGQNAWDPKPPRPHYPGSVGARQSAAQWWGGVSISGKQCTVASVASRIDTARRCKPARRKEEGKLATAVAYACPCAHSWGSHTPFLSLTTPHDVLTCLHSRFEGSVASCTSNHCCKKSVSDPLLLLPPSISSLLIQNQSRFSQAGCSLRPLLTTIHALINPPTPTQACLTEWSMHAGLGAGHATRDRCVWKGGRRGSGRWVGEKGKRKRMRSVFICLTLKGCSTRGRPYKKVGS